MFNVQNFDINFFKWDALQDLQFRSFNIQTANKKVEEIMLSMNVNNKFRVFVKHLPEIMNSWVS